MEILFIIISLIGILLVIKKIVKINKEGQRLIKFKEALDILEEEPYTLYWKGKELSELTDEEVKDFNEFTGLNINQKGERYGTRN